jgi:hypothetical protein
VVVVAVTDARPNVIAAAALRIGRAAPCQLGQQCLRGRLRVTVHRMLDRHLVAQLGSFDVDLRNRRAGRDEPAPLGRPLREARAESGDEVALGDQLVCSR